MSYYCRQAVLKKREFVRKISVSAQKFIKDDPNKANKIIGTLYVLTDGFTKFDGIYKGAVKKEIKR